MGNSIQDNYLQGIADAIRTKLGTEDSIDANDFPQKILDISTELQVPDGLYQIQANVNPSKSGTVIGEGYSSENMTITLEAINGNDTIFDYWEESGENIGVDARISFKIVGNRNLIANFYEPTLLAGRDWFASSLPTSQYWEVIGSGNGKIIILDILNGKGAYSANKGQSWSSFSITAYCWTAMAYGNGIFVAVSNKLTGTTSTSSDKAGYSTTGTSWTTTAAMPSSESWNDVIYGKDKFVAIARYGSAAAYSLDGMTWTATSLPSSKKWNKIAYGNNKYIVIAGDTGYLYNTYAYSEDGITWYEYPFPLETNWVSIAYGNGRFIATGLNGIMISSKDGINWIQLDSLFEYTSYVCFSNGRFLIYDRSSNPSPQMYYSSDGTEWTAVDQERVRIESLKSTEDGFIGIINSNNTDTWNGIYYSYNE